MWPAVLRVRPAALAVLLTVTVGSGLTGCANPARAPQGLGVIAGIAPICYGPGPSDNLHPIVTIRAVRADGTGRQIQVHVSNAHDHYRMTLPVGTYTISAYTGHVTAVIRARTTTTGVDLPQPSCS